MAIITLSKNAMPAYQAFFEGMSRDSDRQQIEEECVNYWYKFNTNICVKSINGYEFKFIASQGKHIIAFDACTSKVVTPYTVVIRYEDLKFAKGTSQTNSLKTAVNRAVTNALKNILSRTELVQTEF